jgi:XTP/dITP diphosphohydrolase
LEIEALDGHPGVYSARYAGNQCSFEDNMNKVLHQMKYLANRNACFRTVIALIMEGKEYLFEGRVDGIILHEKHGQQGFGYDPIFQPLGYKVSFAEMGMEEKNAISHRWRALEKLLHFLKAKNL